MRVVFMGTPAFAVPSLEALARAGHELVAVVAQPDRPAGRGQALREPATKTWARGRGVAVLQPEKVRDGRLAAELALDERARWVVSPFVDRLGTRRTTLTLPILNRARGVLFLVSGAEKAPALARVLAPAPGAEPLPAALVRPDGGELVWVVDRAAASGLGADPERPGGGA